MSDAKRFDALHTPGCLCSARSKRRGQAPVVDIRSAPAGDDGGAVPVIRRLIGPPTHRFTPFGWKGNLSAQETFAVEFIHSLAPSPLRSHLASLHALFAYEQMWLMKWIDGSTDENVKAEATKELADRLSIFEQHLREIAAFTRIDPMQARRIVEASERPKPPRPRRTFTKKGTEDE